MGAMSIDSTLLLLVATLAAVRGAAPESVWLGALFPRFRTSAYNFATDMTGIQRLTAFHLAITEINNKTDGVADELLPNTRIDFAVRDSKRDDASALLAALRLVDNQKVSAIIGAASSGPSAAMALLLGQLNVPQISYSATSAILSDGALFPYFLRTPPSDAFQVLGILKVISGLFGYRQIATVTTTGPYGSGGLSAITQAAQDAGIEILTSVTFNRDTQDLSAKIAQLRTSGVRVIVIFAQAGDGGRFMRMAYQAGVGGPGFLFFGSDGLCRSETWEHDVGGMAEDVVLREQVLKGFFGLSPSLGGGPQFEAFSTRLKMVPSTMPSIEADGEEVCDSAVDSTGTPLWAGDHDGNPTTPIRCAGNPQTFMNSYSPYTYDATFAVARAMHTLLYDLGREAISGAELLSVLLSNVSFVGASGLVEFFDARGTKDRLFNGDRRSGVAYDLWNYNGARHGAAELEVIGTWTPCEGCVWDETWTPSATPMTFSTVDNSLPKAVPNGGLPLGTLFGIGFGGASGVLLVIGLVILRWTRHQRRRLLAKRFLQRGTGLPPVLSLNNGCTTHLFLSHIWVSGQDQVANIKRSLQLALPASRIFLDVDDLDEISRLEEHIAASQCILIFLSKSYFKSKNCLREVRAAAAANKPLVLCQEVDVARGGLSLDDAKGDCPDELLDYVFGSSAPTSKASRLMGGVEQPGPREVIVWHRVTAFQRVSLLRIASTMVAAAKQEEDDWSSAKDMPNVAALSPSKSKAKPKLYCPESITERPVTYAGSISLFVSESNPGAREAAELLLAVHGSAVKAARKQSSGLLKSVRDGAVTVMEAAGLDLDEEGSLPAGALWGRRSFMELNFEDAALRSQAARLLDEAPTNIIQHIQLELQLTTQQVQQLASRMDAESGQDGAAGEPADTSRAHRLPVTHMLLYLNDQTFLGEEGATLTALLMAATDAHIPLLMLHENNPLKGGCPFDNILCATPDTLLAGGLFDQLAIPLYSHPAELELANTMALQALFKSAPFKTPHLLGPPLRDNRREHSSKSNSRRARTSRWESRATARMTTTQTIQPSRASRLESRRGVR
uniref:Receptor ligand binding region domain-containing protein n=1 Tax=Haptolina brevifila TaxID=156173 RepID=A0A7S2BXW5_9EUKA